VRSSLKRRNLKVRVRVRRWIEGNGARVHVTVNMDLEQLVEFSVKVGGVKGKANGMGTGDSKCVKDETCLHEQKNSNSKINNN
jgi:hypothetical protein